MPKIHTAPSSNGNGADYQPCPTGQNPSVLCEVIDEGYSEQTHQGVSKGMKPFVRLVFQSKKTKADGTRYTVRSRKIQLTDAPSGNLRKILISLKGKEWTDEFFANDGDTDNLIGIAGLLNVVHTPRDNGGVFDDIATYSSWDEDLLGAPLTVSPDYEPMQSRPTWKLPDYSAYMPPQEARKLIEADGKSFYPPRPDASLTMPKKEFQEQHPDPRATNNGFEQNRQATLAQGAAAYDKLVDEDDPFADG